MPKKRIFEIDLLKAIAIIMMVIFHLVYDLNEFVGIEIDYTYGFWYWFGRISAFLFIFLAGLNSGFSKHPVKRGAIVFSFGIIITIVTYFFMRDEYVRFGILHFLGLCMIIYPLFKRLNIGVLLIIALTTIYFSTFNNLLLETSFVLFLRTKLGGISIDYYPLFPYLSFFTFGLIAYKLFYYKGKSLFGLKTKNILIYTISKYSLFIYLIHQLIIVGIIKLFFH